MRRTLFIDEAYCWGCKTCEVACKQENRVPEGVKLISVWEEVCGEGEGLDTVFRVNVCKHCDVPECLDACPAEAIVQRDDGIVVLDEAACTGCRACLDACPYHAIAFDEENDVAMKCNLCHHRVDQGLLPACADNVCLGHCIHLADPDQIDRIRSGIRSLSSENPPA